MTEGQLKYQTLMESQRHNLAMENYTARQTAAQERDVLAKEALVPYEQELKHSQKVLNTTNAELGQRRWMSDYWFSTIKYILPTADTQSTAAAHIIGALFG